MTSELLTKLRLRTEFSDDPLHEPPRFLGDGPHTYTHLSKLEATHLLEQLARLGEYDRVMHRSVKEVAEEIARKDRKIEDLVGQLQGAQRLVLRYERADPRNRGRDLPTEPATPRSSTST